MSGAWRRVARLGSLVVLLTACASHAPVAPVRGADDRARSTSSYYTVMRGDTLYSIAFRYGYDYREVAAWNGIKPPYRIYPGQHLRVDWEHSAHARPAPRRAGPARGAKVRRRSAVRPTAPARRATVRRRSAVRPTAGRAAPAPRPSSRASTIGGTAWTWPTQGKLLRTYAPDAQGKKGLDIGGQPGQAVKAAAPGRVVYSGSGLVGYGQLIIVKHDNDYLSAYAHNRKLLVKQGDEVRQGQQIAEMGSTGTDRVMLHFEIRRGGKPVDPMQYLPPP